MVVGNEQVDRYRTLDTSLAAYLYTEGFRILDIDYESHPPNAFFVFDSNGEGIINGFVRLYITGKATVDPATYSRVHKRLSTIVRQQRPWTEGAINA